MKVLNVGERLGGADSLVMETKSCKEARDLFSLHFDGELSPGDSSKLEEHFAACPSCTKAYNEYKSLFEAVHSIPSVKASGDFETRLQARLRREGAPRRGSSWWRDLSRIPLPVPLSAAAIILIAVFSYTRFSSDRPTTPPTPGEVAVPEVG